MRHPPSGRDSAGVIATAASTDPAVVVGVSTGRWIAIHCRYTTMIAGARLLDSMCRKEIRMKWQTPYAIDLRFGMEITMYIANR
jgi:coenzyme PQQ precursor peptide PqqA